MKRVFFSKIWALLSLLCLANVAWANVPTYSVDCDSLFFWEGKIEAVRVVAYDNDKISYLPCDDAAGIKRVILTSELKRWKRAGGVEVKYAEKPLPKERETWMKDYMAWSHALGIASIVTFLPAWYFISNFNYLINSIFVGVGSEIIILFFAVGCIIGGLTYLGISLGLFNSVMREMKKHPNLFSKKYHRRSKLLFALIAACIIAILASLVLVFG